MGCNIAPVRIAFNARLLVNQPLEGLGRYTLEVLRGLLTAFPSAEFLVLTDRSGDVPPLPRAVQQHRVLPPTRHVALIWAWFELALPPVLRKWHADVFVSLDNFCSLRTKVPTVLVIHDLAYRHLPEGVSAIELAFYRRYMQRYARRADALLAVSEYTRQDIATSYGLPADAIQVAYNGVRPRFSQLSPKRVDAVRDRLTKGAPYFLYVGAVHPRKNVDGLVRAYNLLRQRLGASLSQPPQLVIAGRMSWDTNATATAIQNSAFREHIKVLGFVPDEELANVVGASHALVLPSFFEGFGVPLVEAMACGVPVITSNVSSLPEVAGEAGLLVDPHDDASIADAMYTLVTDAEVWQVLAKAGPGRAAKFSWQQPVAQIAEAIQSLAQTTR